MLASFHSMIFSSVRSGLSIFIQSALSIFVIWIFSIQIFSSLLLDLNIQYGQIKTWAFSISTARHATSLYFGLENVTAYALYPKDWL